MEEEGSQVLQRYESHRLNQWLHTFGTYLWIIFGPDFAEPLIHVIIKQSPILCLCFLVTFQDDGNKQLQEYEADEEHKTDKEGESVLRVPTPHHLMTVCFVVCEGRRLNTLICR